MEYIILMGIFWLLVPILFGMICCRMAEKRGRCPVIGFILGFLFGIFAIIGYALVGETEMKKLERIEKVVGKTKKK